MACKGGTYKNFTGQGDCIICGVDTYSNITAATSENDCLACPYKTFSMAESNQIVDCTCMKGYTGADGTACTACNKGTYKSDTGSGQCTDCDEGSYSTTEAAQSKDTCRSCQSNSASNSGSTSNDDCRCNDGFYDSANS